MLLFSTDVGARSLESEAYVPPRLTIPTQVLKSSLHRPVGVDMRLCFGRGAAIGTTLAIGLSSQVAAATTNVQDGSGARGARWQQNVVQLTLDNSVDEVDASALEALVGAVSAWQQAGAEVPTLIVKRGEAGKLGYHKGEENTNSVVFARSGLAKADGALAITITTFDAQKGEILDADIVLNGEHAFRMMSSDPGASDAYDLQNVLTHEVGHFLGLGEEYDDEDATMFAFSRPGETRKRRLAARDTDTVTGLYLDNSATRAPENCAASISRRGAENGYGTSLLGLMLGLALFHVRRRQHKAALLSATTAAGVLLGLSMNPVELQSATVSALSARWDGGVIVSTAQLTPQGCASCSPIEVQVLGGRVGHISQRVGKLRPLSVGQSVDLPSILQGRGAGTSFHHSASNP